MARNFRLGLLKPDPTAVPLTPAVLEPGMKLVRVKEFGFRTPAKLTEVTVGRIMKRWVEVIPPWGGVVKLRREAYSDMLDGSEVGTSHWGDRWCLATEFDPVLDEIARESKRARAWRDAKQSVGEVNLNSLESVEAAVKALTILTVALREEQMESEQANG